MLFDRLSQSASRHPDRVAAADPGASLTFGQLHETATRLGQRIARFSPSPDEPVAILLPTSVGFAVAFHAIQSAGRTALPLNFLLAPAELAAVLADSGAKLILTARAMSSSFASPAPGPQLVFLEDLLADIDSEPASRAGQPISNDRPAVLLYTSGSTGEAKGVMLSPGNLLADALGCIEMAEMLEEERFFGALPLFHAFGLTALLIVPNILGATVHYQPRLNPRAALETLARERVTVVMAIPSIYTALVKAACSGKAQPSNHSRIDLPQLRLPISGGEPLSASLADRFRAVFGTSLLEGYGLTEASPVVSLSLPGAMRAGTVGRPLPNIEVRIIDDAGRPCPPGACGQVVVAGPTVMLGYRGRPDATAAAKTPDGALRTGDLGEFDADGFLRIAGRIKDLIIVGGENVCPGEVERVLDAHPLVARAACVGVPDETRGQAVAAFVQPADLASPPDPADLRAFCRERLAGYKVPRKFTIMPDLPVGPTGKVLKRQLR
jgi:long-chain acyl-CoA synthetase